MEHRKRDLERGLEGSSSQFEKLKGVEVELRSRVSDLESCNQDLEEDLTSLKKDAIG